jgi:hypothetical protein
MSNPADGIIQHRTSTPNIHTNTAPNTKHHMLLVLDTKALIHPMLIELVYNNQLYSIAPNIHKNNSTLKH